MKLVLKLFFAIILLCTGNRNSYAENLNKVYTPASKLVKGDSLQYNQTANNSVSGKTNKQLASASIAIDPTTDAKEKLDNSPSDPVISSSEENQSRSELDDTKNQRLNKMSFYKIGFTLAIFGFVVGFMFGRAAFLIATTGIVFLVIGYFI
jgi:hypothetical protein